MTVLYSIGDFVEFVDRPMPTQRMASLWYLLRLHPNYDLKAERQCNEHGIEVYVPKEKKLVKSVWGRKILKETPIFSGAMFIPDFEADLARLKRVASGIGGFVRNGDQPLTISLSWMDRIRQFETRMQSTSGKRKFHINQHVRIVGGQFDMWEGRIERLDSHYRLRVLINLMQGEVPVEIGEDQIEAV